MTSLALAALIGVAGVGSPAAQAVSSELESRLTKYDSLVRSSKVDPAAAASLTSARTENRERVEGLIERDKLQTGRDFYLASKLYVDIFYFEVLQVNYELLLTASLLGDQQAVKELPRGWDNLFVSMGIGQRLGSATRSDPASANRSAQLPFAATKSPEAIRLAWMDPLALKSRAVGAVPNPDLQALVKEDQSDRASISKEKIPLILSHDRLHRERAMSIIAEGKLVAAEDFFNAGLIFQHGEQVEDFALAHECGVIAALLGHSGGPSLCSVSYDRMLLACGHPQRFGTQLGPFQKWSDNRRMSKKERSTLMAPDALGQLRSATGSAIQMSCFVGILSLDHRSVQPAAPAPSSGIGQSYLWNAEPRVIPPKTEATLGCRASSKDLISL